MRGGRRVLHLFLTLSAAGLALVTIFTFAARLSWAFDLFSHFRLQYVVAALILGLAALAVRAYPTAAVLAVVALVHGWAIGDLWWGGGANAAPGGLPLRVVSANVWAENPTPDNLLRFVRASDADLVLLVDARFGRWRPVLDELESLYPFHSQRRWRRIGTRHTVSQGAPVILFSRYPILTAEAIRPAGGRRPYLVAKLQVGGNTIMVVGVHSSSPQPNEPHRSRSRNRELSHIADAVGDADAPVIVAGDFNVTAWSPYFHDLLAAAGLRDAGVGQGYVGTWPTFFWPALIPIDHVLVRGPLAVTTLRRGPDVGSDHYPLIADLRLLSSP